MMVLHTEDRPKNVKRSTEEIKDYVVVFGHNHPGMLQ